MKKSILKIVTTAFLLIAMNTAGWSQPPPPAAHGESGNAPAGGGGAPIGDGMFLLLAMSAAYSARKIYSARREEDES